MAPGKLGDRFIRGVVLHTGPSRWSIDERIDERIDAVPIAAIWS